jgi:Alpha/beta hydrolase domain
MRFAALLLAIGAGSTLSAAVKEVHVVERGDVLNGSSFGAAGPYECIRATVNFAVDPKNPSNRVITDIDLAPRNQEGLVEFSADLVMYKPRDPKLGNGTALVEIVNRGHGGAFSMFDRASAATGEFGDHFLLDRGYTVVWLGWQFDVPANPSLLRLRTPVARDGSKTITGLVRAEFAPLERTTTMPLADRNHQPYAPMDLNDAGAVMTVREKQDGPARKIARSEWRFADDGHATMAKGFEPGRMYDIVYTVKDPPVVGLGPAAIRDFVSFLKYGGTETLLSDERQYIKHAMGFGTSQSGRFLRTFVYYGFNADEKNRMVFDGVWAHVAGTGRGSFNYRFAQPSRDGHPFMNWFYPNDIFPFTDLPETDAETGATAGLLDRAQATHTVPKIFYTNGSYEYWGRGASLIHTSPDGRQDAGPGPDTRIYFLTGTQHGPAGTPSRKYTQNLTNPSDYRWTMRALLVAMQAWVTEGAAPPDSRYPRVDRDQLVATSTVQFPKIAGVHFPATNYHVYHLDFGPQLISAGIVTKEPPKIGRAFPTLVPQVDRDGNETAGVRAPELAVPLATYTGWNLRAPEIGAPGVIYDMAGSFIPFARTKAEREKSGDPRLSIEERYASRSEYLNKVGSAAADLARQHYLLETDIPGVKDAAGARWDAIMAAR